MFLLCSFAWFLFSFRIYFIFLDLWKENREISSSFRVFFEIKSLTYKFTLWILLNRDFGLFKMKPYLARRGPCVLVGWTIEKHEINEHAWCDEGKILVKRLIDQKFPFPNHKETLKAPFLSNVTKPALCHLTHATFPHKSR